MAQFHLHEEIITEILKRLPVKSLLRFRCVEKLWYSLIHNLQFITLHLKHQENSSSANKYLHFNYTSSRSLSIRFDTENFDEYYWPEFRWERPHFRASANGLICLTSQIKNLSKKIFFERDIHLWNPALRKFLTLPSRYIIIDNLELYSNIKVKLGFGFLPKFNDYRVVKIIKGYKGFMDKNIIAVDVYSLSSNSWKKISLDGLLDIYLCCTLVFVNEIVFLRGWNTKKNVGLIVCFDMENDVVRQISLPENCQRHTTLSLRAYDKSVALFDKDQELKLLTMWVMEEGFSWKKKIIVSMEGNINWSILGVRNNGIDLVMLLNRSDFAFYNVQKKETEKIVKSSNVWKHYNRQRVKIIPYMESLVGLHNFFDYKHSTKMLT